LPYNAISATKGITVAAVSLTLSVDNNKPLAGQTIKFSGKLTKDGVGWAGESVAIKMLTPFREGWRTVASATTGADGSFSASWTVPWSISGTFPDGTTGSVNVPCNRWEFSAYHSPTLTSSPSIYVWATYNTRISISAPASVAVNQVFGIDGVLEYESASGVWSGLGGRVVSVYYNGTKIGDATTASDGKYSATASIPASGAYTLKASYAGEGFGLAPALALLGIGVEVPLEPLAQYATYALAAVPVLAVVGTIAYNELRR
jgi:hypothetical protein